MSEPKRQLRTTGKLCLLRYMLLPKPIPVKFMKTRVGDIYIRFGTLESVEVRIVNAMPETLLTKNRVDFADECIPNFDRTL